MIIVDLFMLIAKSKGLLFVLYMVSFYNDLAAILMVIIARNVRKRSEE